jgi:methanesulfonate monooxygenase small subunit
MKMPATTAKEKAKGRGAIRSKAGRDAGKPRMSVPVPANGSSERIDKAVRELIYRSCLSLDRMDFGAYMSLCDPDFHYVISTYSPELRKDIIWLDHDRRGMKLLFDVLPKHVSDNVIRLSLSRHVTVYTIEYNKDHTLANTVSALQVFTTTKDGGITALLGVAKYYDTIRLNGGDPRLLSREVRLETRMLGETGCHIPF